MDYLIKIENRKLNKKRVALVVIIAILVIIFFIALFLCLKNNKENKNESRLSDNIENLVQIENTVEENVVEEPKYNFEPLNVEEFERFDSIYKASDPKRVFLTFDDGPTNQVTPYILDLLKNEDIKASFFVLGNRVDANPELVKREYEEGHFIGNHGYSHKYSAIYASADTVMEEYYRTNQSIRDAIGNQEYNSLAFRFPGGSVGGYYDSLKKATKQVLREKGIASVDWNALIGDSEGLNTKEKLISRFYETVQNQNSVVLLMHDAADKILTYEVLPEIISYFRENGYEFRSLYDVILREN